MLKSMIIIDDFLNDPHQLRDLALAQEYPRPDEPAPYPGHNSKHQQVIRGLDQKLSEIIGEPLVPVEGTPWAKFRLALEGEKGTGGIHVDNAHWTAILYLTLPEHCRDGTHLYRHLPTGTDRAPINRGELAKYGATSAHELCERILQTDTNDMSKWEKTFTVPMRFNRMMLFRPQQWHDAGLSFGDSVENGRLVYLNFYQNANG